MSTADATDVEFTKRQSKSVRIDVICPVAIKEYNHGPKVFIKLLGMDIYARGTVRANRKYLPSFIQLKNQT